MLPIPSREALAALAGRARAVVPSAILGFTRRLDPGRVSLLYSYPHGIGEFVVPDDDVPHALLPETAGRQEIDAAAIAAQSGRPVEWQLQLAGARRLWSDRVADHDPPARIWIGLTDADRLTDERRVALRHLAASSTAVLTGPGDNDANGASLAQLHRLELAAELLPVLLHVLDVREVFDRLSTISAETLPHDMLALGLFSEDLTEITMHARTGPGPSVGRTYPHPYPPDVTRVRHFEIIDDRAIHPLEHDREPTKHGMRSHLRLPIRFGDRVFGNLTFMSTAAGRYTSADVPVGRRLSDHVAVALSHHEMAERLAVESRRNEELRARTDKADLLDELLASVTGDGTLPEVFDRVSDVAQRVLAHDALILTVVLPNGVEAKVYAQKTPPHVPFPDIVAVPPLMLANPQWEFDLIDDLRARADQTPLTARVQGYRGALRVPIRFDDEYVAGLSFLSFTPAQYTPADIPVARRIADRVALSFAKERGAALSKRADEASARAAQLESRVRALTDELDARTGYRRVVGDSRQWRQVLTQATQVAGTDTTVLLLGESGTGKEVIARFLHRASGRNGGPFIALNCAALPEQLLEAELFGYERGAYTGATQSKPGQLEQAAGGTLFLDEVGEMSPSAQAKFLRVLQEREFQRLGGTRVLRTDARIVAATNRDLPKAIANGQFREDLFYRLNVFAIRLPALRDRRDDVLPLSDAFLAEIGRGLGRPAAGISRDARQLLIDYPWPGNVRELRNILERAAILCDGGLITADHLGFMPIGAALSWNPAAPSADLSAASWNPVTPSGNPPALSGNPPAPSGNIASVERTMIAQALEAARFNKSKAAKALGLTRHQLYLRMQKYGLE